MMNTLREVVAFRAADGTLWESRGEAERRQAQLELEEWVAATGIGRGGEWSADMVLRALLDDAANLGRILSALGAAA